MTLTVTEDPTEGWNVHADITNFRFAPEHVSGDNVDGEGHMHLYVNGVKIQRMYGNWWHLPELAKGDNTIMVEANANDHTPYLVDGVPISASTVVVGTDDVMKDEGEHDGHDMGDDDTMEHDEDALVLDIDYAAGEFTGVESRVSVELGQTVKLTVSSDAAEQVHVHGYDKLVEVGPGSDGTITFVADIPGVFEVEFEQSGGLITELEVR